MRLIKMFGLAALAAVAAMAFVGASSAMAENPTALCKVAEDPCAEANQVKEFHAELTTGTVGVLDGTEPNTDVLCLKVLALGEVLKLQKLQEVHLSKLDFKECGVIGSGSHSNCTVESKVLPILIDVLEGKVKLEGTAIALNGKTFVKCIVFGFIKIECEYDGTGLEFNVKSAGGTNGHGMLNAAGTALTKTSGGSLCPETSKISEGLLEPLTDTYIEL